MTDDTLTTSEVAAALDLRRDTVARRCARGHIDAEKVGGEWKIPRSEVGRIRDERWRKHGSTTARIHPGVTG